MDLKELKNMFKKEFLHEQIKSFVIAILVNIGIMFVISILSDSLTMKTLLTYYDYKMFLIFSLIVYGINMLIYDFSLKRILETPTIELIRTE
ncbi:MAG: ABC transporter permease, partial [Peptoniphilus sp.]|jgi:putative ABC transport system permease protein